MFRFEPMEIEGVWSICPERFDDARGCFFEVFVPDELEKIGIRFPFFQINRSVSRRGVLRGLHEQFPPQAKLVSVAKGRIFDVAADVRPGSPTYGRHVHAVLDGESGRMLYIPKGFVHGFLVLSEEAVVTYVCSAPYAPGRSGGVRWDDPTLNISWPEQPAVLSEKDRALPFLEQRRRAF